MDDLLRRPTTSSPGQLFWRPIAFCPAVKERAGALRERPDEGLLIPLNAPFQADQYQQGTHSQGMPGPLMYGPHLPSSRGAAGGLRSRQELFREEDVQLHWSSVTRAGAGLMNLGNTCFMNSVLQCLAHTPPLAEAVLSGRCTTSGHAQCPPTSSSSDDPLANTLAHIKRVFTAHGIVKPAGQVKTLRTVNKRFRVGRQEDSHEYLRCLLDALHEACLKPFKPKPPPHLAATTFINRIFGARLRSRIRCHGVDYESSTYEGFMDLSLEINRASTVMRALQHFTAKETLDGDNKYRCPKNHKLVRAEKQITIEEAPNVLTIHLKRFQFGGMGSKITKQVIYDKEMNLQPFMSQPECGPQWYDLYGVLVHLGHTVHSGHYYCFVRAGNGMWHKCDDTSVGQCSERTALGQQAYILFYVRRHPRTHASQPTRTSSAHATAPSARQRTAAANTANGNSQHANGILPNGKAAAVDGGHLANGLTSNGKAKAVNQGVGNQAAANGPVKANGAVKASKLKENGPIAGEDTHEAGAPIVPNKGAAASGSKRVLPDASQATNPAAVAEAAAPGVGPGSNGLGVGVDGGVLHPPSKKARGAGEEQLRGSRVVEGLLQQHHHSSSVLHSQGQGLQGPGSGGDVSSPIISSPFAQPSSSGQRGQLFTRMAERLSRYRPTSGLSTHLSAHLHLHLGHRSQRLARELRAKSRTEVKQQQQEQQQQQQHPEVNVQPQGEDGQDEGLRQQGGAIHSHLRASTHGALASQSSPQPLTSPEQRHTGRSRKQQQQQQQQERGKTEAANEGPQAPHSKGTDGSKDGSQLQGHQNEHTQPHRTPRKQQQPQQQQQQHHATQQQPQSTQKLPPQQQGEGEQVLVGADAARLLGSGNLALGGGGALRQGKPAGVQPWDDVDPQVAQQQANTLGRQQQKRSRQLDAWDQDYDAGKTKKVRNKDRAGADLHAGGNAFQVFQQQKRGGGSNNKQRRGSKEGKGFGGSRNRGGRVGGRGGSARFAGRGRGRGGGKFRE